MTTPDPGSRHGLGDPRIPWVVLLDVELDEPPDPGSVAERLAAVAASAGWAAPSATAVTTGERRELYGRLTGADAEAVRVGVHDRGVVLAARHDVLDGLAMLGVAGRLVDASLHSSARGVEPGRAHGGATAVLRRAWEVTARPPARVAPSAAGSSSERDAFAAATVEGSPRVADLVHAGSRAVVAWNRRHGRSSRRVSVAVGVSTIGGSSYALGDHSAFLRLGDVEDLDLDAIRTRLAVAPIQPGGRVGPGRLVAAVTGPVLRLAAPRLGSTLLVSHLGSVEAPGGVRTATFHPVTGGGSGLSLGAATVHGRTTITLRGRGSQHDDEGLQGLLALVVEAWDGRAQRA